MAKTVSVEMVGGKPVKRVGNSKTAAAVLLDETTAKQQKTVTALVPTVTAQVEALGVIEDEDTYHVADKYFGRVKTARKEWAGRMQEIIRPIRQGLDKLYKLNRDVDQPLAQLETRIEALMKDFKLKELQRVREEQEQADQEAARLRGLLENAKTPIKQQALAQQLEEVEAWQPETTKGENSSSRPSRKVRIVDLKAFAKAVGAGLIPEDVLLVHMPAVNRYFKDDAETVEGWPGVEGFDDIAIVSR